MAQLLFFDQGHRYELDGVEVPSVSTILRFLTREIYSEVRQADLDRAAERGSRVHKALELLDKLGEVDADAETEPYIRAYIKFRQEHACDWTGIEKPVVNEQLRYAGTADRIGTVDGQPTIIDFKCQSSIHKPLVKAQLNGYLLCMDKPHQLACLQLLPTAKYRLLPCDGGPEAVLGLSGAARNTQAKERKGENRMTTQRTRAAGARLAVIPIGEYRALIEENAKLKAEQNMLWVRLENERLRKELAEKDAEMERRART